MSSSIKIFCMVLSFSSIETYEQIRKKKLKQAKKQIHQRKV